MGDPSKSSNTDNVKLSRQKTVCVKDFCKTYRSLLHKWNSDGHPASPKDHDKLNISEPKLLSRTVSTNAVPITPNRHPSKNSPDSQAAADADGFTISTPMLLVRATSYLNPIPCSPMKLSRNSIEQTSTTNRPSIDDDGELHISSPTLLARTTSRITGGGQIPRVSTPSSRMVNSSRADHSHGSNFSEPSSSGNTPKVTRPMMTTPIFFSQSGARRKPPPVEKKLECSLEELCFGCVKKINITRDALSRNGLIIQEQEVLTIKVQPGWQKGTKIIFEGKGDERPGTLPADIIFEIVEKRHPLYSRRGDHDLELGVKVPLKEALTGCRMSVPLLGGEEREVRIEEEEEEVIYPGYETAIPEEGMPRPKEHGGGGRGDLILVFMVEFPSELSKEQRSQVATILEECYYTT